MLTMDYLQAKVGQSVAIIRRPNTKIGQVIKEFRKIAQNFGRWIEPDQTMCGAGCSHCCYGMPVLKSRLEFDSVQKAIKFNFLHTGPWMRKYVDKWREFAKILGPTDKDTLDAWRGAGIPCPMLNDKKQCEIYAERPIVCRIRWTPQYYLADCFASSPIFPMADGPAQASAYEIRDSLIPRGPRRHPDTPVVQIIEATLRDIDKWVYNVVGKPRPLVEAIGLHSVE